MAQDPEEFMRLLYTLLTGHSPNHVQGTREFHVRTIVTPAQYVSATDRDSIPGTHPVVTVCDICEWATAPGADLNDRCTDICDGCGRQCSGQKGHKGYHAICGPEHPAEDHLRCFWGEPETSEMHLT